MSISVFHQTARNYAKAGIPDFPCWPREKSPATERGYLDASDDLEQIDRWWHANPDYNVALCPDMVGWAVVDEEGDAAPGWSNGHALPETYTVRTPRGGTHRIYAGSVPSTVAKLAPRVDTRGEGGYILVAPSVVFDPKTGKTGRYKTLNKMDPVELPEWISQALAKTAPKAEAPANIKLDDPGNVMRAIRHLKSLPFAKEKDGCDAKAYAAACVMKDLGLSAVKAHAVLVEHFKAEPRDGRWQAFLERKVAHAYKNGENAVGAYAAPSLQESFGAVMAEVPVAPVIKSRFYFEDDDEMDLTKEPDWIVKDLLPENSIVLLTAKKGSFKTFIAMDLCLGIATGKETFGITPTRVGPTFYGAHEGIHHIKKTHRRAWRLAKEVSGKTDFYVAPGPRIGQPEECEEFVRQIIERCGKRRPRLIVLDTYSACMLGLDENNPGDANRFIAFCRELIQLFPGCSVLVPAHFGKDEDRGTRGSNALEAGVDTVLEMRRHDKTRLAYVRVKNHRGAAEREQPFYFEGHSLANSLVFNPITAEQYTKATAQENVIGYAKVSAALKSHRCIGVEKGVTSTVLARMLAPCEASESPEEWEVRIKGVSRDLGKRAERDLSGYCEKMGKDWLWFIPITT